MRKKLLTLNLAGSFAVMGLLFIVGGILLPLITRTGGAMILPDLLANIALTACLAIIAMLTRRVITTRWGNFLHAWLTFLALYTVLEILSGFTGGANGVVLVIVFSLAGIVVFQFLDRIVNFSRTDKPARPVKRPNPAGSRFSPIVFGRSDIFLRGLVLYLVYLVVLAAFHRTREHLLSIVTLISLTGLCLPLLVLTFKRLVLKKELAGLLVEYWSGFFIFTIFMFVYFLVAVGHPGLKWLFWPFAAGAAFSHILSDRFLSMSGDGNRDLKKLTKRLAESLAAPASTVKKLGDRIARGLASLRKNRGTLLPRLKTGSIRLFRSPVFWTAAAVVLALSLTYGFFTVRVTEAAPRGIVAAKTSIRIVFSGPVASSDAGSGFSMTNARTSYSNVSNITDVVFLGSADRYIAAKPPLRGDCRLEQGRILVFTPEKELAPATRYTIRVLTKGLKSRKRFIMGRTFSFSTRPFAVNEIRLFFSYEPVNNLEKETVALVDFNYPVDIDVLRGHLKMSLDASPLTFTVEPANIPSRFYIRSGVLKRGTTLSSVRLTVRKGLRCLGGRNPLAADQSAEIQLPAKVRLQVLSVKAFPVTGTTYVAVQFNLPVSDEMINRYVQVRDGEKKPVRFKLETEYCFAMFKADFQPNKTYKILIPKEIRARTGETPSDDFEQAVTIQDLPPKVGFASAGTLLPLGGEQNIEVQSLNLDSFNIEMSKIYRNNLVAYLSDPYSSRLTTQLLYQSFKVEAGELNKPVSHFISLRKLHDREYKGLFKIRVSDPNDSWEREEKAFLCTDLGLIAKQSGSDLLIRVYSLGGLAPVDGVTVSIFSRENQVIRSGVTGPDGECLLKDWQVNKSGFTPFVLTAEKGEDFSFLQFGEDELNMSRFGVEGENLGADGLKAFLTPERGVYRPGDDVYLTAIVRKGENLDSPPPVEIQMNVTDPSGDRLVLSRRRIPDRGMMLFKISVPAFARTGTYDAVLRLNERSVIGRTSFKVEEFIPDKIKVEVAAPDRPPRPNEPVSFGVKAVQLFGPPASGRKLHTQIRLVSREFSVPALPGYVFSDATKTYQGEFLDLGDSVLDPRGEKQYSVPLPTTSLPPSALTARITTEVFDVGGRPVSAVRNIPIDPYPVYIGLKTEAKDIRLKDEPVSFSYLAVTPAGSPATAKHVRLLVRHKVYYTILKRYGLFNERYESDTWEEVVQNRFFDIDGGGRFSFTPSSAGEYTVILGNDDGMRTSLSFYVQGPGLESVDMESANNLVIRLNKKRYTIGETATATVVSPIPGRLFFSVERERVLFSRTVMLENGKAVISFPVTRDFSPNVYVSGYVVRKPDESMKTLPMSSLGIQNLEIAPGDREMALVPVSADVTRSRRGLDVACHVPAASAHSALVLFAVDEGILQITQFETPDPYGFFYRKRALLTRLFSVFNSVLPNVRADKLAIGGDEGEYDISRRHINPVQARRVKAVALTSDVLFPDSDGNIFYHFTLPEFNGKLRVTALAADRDRFGKGSRYVTVADPIVITPSYPRALAPGDEFEVTVAVYNKTGADGDFRIAMGASGPVRVKGSPVQAVRIPREAERKIVFLIRTLEDAGKAVFRLTAEGNGESSETTTELPVRPAHPATTIVYSGVLGPRESRELAVPQGFIRSGQRVRVFFSPDYLVQYLRGLDYLISYPYGCLEQTVSTVFPLIYLKKMSFVSELAGRQDGSIDRFIAEGIKKIEGMQKDDGSFTYWPGGTESYKPVSLYASHFLLEADRAGFEVDPDVLKKITASLDADETASPGRLDRREVNREDAGMTGEDLFVLYLKALIAKPDRESMDYLRLNSLKKLSYSGLCRLAAGYALIGDRKTARSILPTEFKLKYFPRPLECRMDSYLGRLSLYAMALSDIDSADPVLDRVAQEIVRNGRDGFFQTTMDTASALMALYRIFGSGTGPEILVNVSISNRPYRTLTGRGGLIRDDSLAGKTLSFRNDGGSKACFTLMAEGTTFRKEKNVRNNGMQISREYFNKDGSRLNPTSVEQGQLIVATITLKPERTDLDNIAVVDMLPAGCEIENPRLQSRGRLDFTPPCNWTSAYEDIRDDRLLLFTGRVSGTLEYSYTMRAVSPGVFEVPSVYAEAMYDPEVRARGKNEEKMHVARSTD